MLEIGVPEVVALLSFSFWFGLIWSGGLGFISFGVPVASSSIEVCLCSWWAAFLRLELGSKQVGD